MVGAFKPYNFFFLFMCAFRLFLFWASSFMLHAVHVCHSHFSHFFLTGEPGVWGVLVDISCVVMIPRLERLVWFGISQLWFGTGFDWLWCG